MVCVKVTEGHARVTLRYPFVQPPDRDPSATALIRASQAFAGHDFWPVKNSRF